MSSAAYETICYEVDPDARVATVTLNRPDVLNAFNRRMCEEIRDVWHVVKDDDAVHAVVLRAAGDRAFSAGLDTQQSFGQPDVVWNHLDPGEYLSPKWQKLWKPVVCAVHGICTAGAFYFLNEADVVICSPNASFTEPHTSHGLTAAVEMVGLSWRVPMAYALRLGLMGRHERMTPEQALQIGLVTEVVPHEQLLQRAHEIADTINLNSPLASRATVETMWRSKDMGRNAALEFAYTMAIYHNGMSVDPSRHLNQEEERDVREASAVSSGVVLRARDGRRVRFPCRRGRWRSGATG